MVPASVAGVVTFLLLVAPGITYELVRRRRVHPEEESTFLQISRVLLCGTIISAVSAMFLLFAEKRSSTIPMLIDVRGLLEGGVTYAAEHAGLLGKTVFLQLAVSILLAASLCDLRNSQHNMKVTPGTGLFAVAEYIPPPNSHVQLDIRLKDESAILGFYYGSTTELEPDKRELIVQRPIREGDPSSGKPPGHVAEQWEYVLIPFREVDRMYVGYSKGDIPKESPRRQELKKAIANIAEKSARWFVAGPSAIVLILAFSFPWG